MIISYKTYEQTYINGNDCFVTKNFEFRIELRIIAR